MGTFTPKIPPCSIPMQTRYQKTIKRIAWIGAAFTAYSEDAPGSVADCLNQYVQGLRKLNVHSTLILPPGSKSVHHHVVVVGELQPSMLVASRTNETQSALQNMVDWAWEHQSQFDLIVNLGHDYLPHSMIGKFQTPFISIPNMGKASPQLDALVQQRAKQYPKNIWFFSKAQRSYLGVEDNPIINQGFNVEHFPLATAVKSGASLAWAGRIVPEKGLEAALKIAQALKIKLNVAGSLDDPQYFAQLQSKFPKHLVEWDYLGNLPRDLLFSMLHSSRALLQTQEPLWAEAFGRVTAEALLCGCPVLYTDCGANDEIVRSVDGGFQVGSDTPQNVMQLIGLQTRGTIQEKAKSLFGQIPVARRFLAQAQDLFYPEKSHPLSDIAKEVPAKDSLNPIPA